MPQNCYEFLLDTYETEILKTAGVWREFPDSAMDFRPDPKTRRIREQMEHQVESEERWMRVMLGIDTGGPQPRESTRSGFVEKYTGDAGRRLEMLRAKPESWWRGSTTFFDVERSRAWVMLRRITHSAHHRGQLVAALRMLGRPQPSVYGPTADTGGRVIYSFESGADG